MTAGCECIEKAQSLQKEILQIIRPLKDAPNCSLGATWWTILNLDMISKFPILRSNRIVSSEQKLSFAAVLNFDTNVHFTQLVHFSSRDLLERRLRPTPVLDRTVCWLRSEFEFGGKRADCSSAFLRTSNKQRWFQWGAPVLLKWWLGQRAKFCANPPLSELV